MHLLPNLRYSIWSEAGPVPTGRFHSARWIGGSANEHSIITSITALKSYLAGGNRPDMLLSNLRHGAAGVHLV